MMQFLNIHPPRIGLRVLKTAVATSLALYVASRLHLPGYTFAGVISILAMQQSLIRSLEVAKLQIASSLLGATFGSLVAYFVGGHPVIAGVLVYVLFALHLWLGWKTTMNLAVVTGINALLTFHGNLWVQAFDQFMLVIVGVLSSLLVNLIGPTPYIEKTRMLIDRVSGMQRGLLYMLYDDLTSAEKMPIRQYEQQITDVLSYIEEAQHYAELVIEDKWVPLRKSHGMRTIRSLHIMERQMESIRSMARSVQQIEVDNDMIPRIRKLLRVLIQVQRRMFSQRRIPFRLMDACFENLDRRFAEMELPETREEFLTWSGLYHFYDALKTFYEKIKRLQG
ncbi:membrane protein [Collibacillus ludicampi]|jgi:uncharacterized membrane protein YgaE (UPF0421/DUF939 family)|uniref:Membrane protein n=1 Tax=Collibacillus ludicampi TaxID=2771369 RepID=A0AAV4LJN4_9BACL|nr:aromatic acid exporter family protein [Collibacillus ludicampi]GIM47577.1 membrane protein [Collibacillus ludicampi]